MVSAAAARRRRRSWDDDCFGVAAAAVMVQVEGTDVGERALYVYTINYYYFIFFFRKHYPMSSFSPCRVLSPQFIRHSTPLQARDPAAAAGRSWLMWRTASDVIACIHSDRRAAYSDSGWRTRQSKRSRRLHRTTTAMWCWWGGTTLRRRIHCPPWRVFLLSAITAAEATRLPRTYARSRARPSVFPHFARFILRAAPTPNFATAVVVISFFPFFFF